MPKKLNAQLHSYKSDVVVDEILTSAGLDRNSNAATVVRDANGKVIRVEVNLPDNASDAAKSAIEANLGVASVGEVDLGGNFFNWDSQTLLEDVQKDDGSYLWPIVSYNPDESVVSVESDGLLLSGIGTSYDVSKYNIQGQNAAPLSSTTKIETSSNINALVTQLTVGIWIWQNGKKSQLSLYMRDGATSFYTIRDDGYGDYYDMATPIAQGDDLALVIETNNDDTIDIKLNDTSITTDMGGRTLGLYNQSGRDGRVYMSFKANDVTESLKIKDLAISHI